jgi:exodeoxyribonuclease V alpha subunit
MSTSGEPVSGVVERITFHNLDNGYVVLKVRAPKHRELITVVGTLSNVVAGEYIEARGQWVNDRTHGVQFKADELRTTPPHTAEGIAKYLGSGLIKGIGPTYAKRIVEVFGDKTLDVIDQSPTFLSEVKGIGPQRLERIRASWQEQKGVRSIMVFLQSYGIGTARAVRIYKQYGDNSIEQVKSNPYRLTTDIWGIGFKTADDLATRLGLPKDSPLRARAAVRYILQELSTKGHVAYPEHGVIDETMRLTNIAPEIIREAIEAGRQEDELVRDVAKTVPPEGTDQEWLYLKPLFLAEVGVARAIRTLARGGHPLPEIKLDAALQWVQGKMQLELAPTQREAIEAATREKVLVITGGPGVGKTTIVRGLIEIFAAKRQRIALAAPTGRAAKRLSESTGREAKTIHRLLEFDPAIGRFKRDRENPLEVDLLVVDEASMVDVVLMNQLLRAVPPWCCVVFVGDVDQLPSVGAGTVLRDLIESKVVRVVRLTHIFRQAGASYIIRAAHAINSGQEPESAPDASGDFFFVEADTPEQITDRLISLVKDRIPARFGLDPLRDIQVLSPMNKSELGVNALNQRLQEVLNPAPPNVKQVERFGRTFRVGDKVIQVQNDYQKDVFNGDIGRVAAIEPVDQELTVDYDGRLVTYDFNELDELSLAFTCTIHKAQGSEYPAVVIPLHTQHFVMLQRNLLYTGVTRGKKLVALVGSRKALYIAVQKQDTAFRYSMLRQRLQAADSADAATDSRLREVQ